MPQGSFLLLLLLFFFPPGSHCPAAFRDWKSQNTSEPPRGIHAWSDPTQWHQLRQSRSATNVFPNTPKSQRRSSSLGSPTSTSSNNKLLQRNKPSLVTQSALTGDNIPPCDRIAISNGFRSHPRQFYWSVLKSFSFCWIILRRGSRCRRLLSWPMT